MFKTVVLCHIAPSHLQPKSLEDFVAYATIPNATSSKGKILPIKPNHCDFWADDAIFKYFRTYNVLIM